MSAAGGAPDVVESGPERGTRGWQVLGAVVALAVVAGALRAAGGGDDPSPAASATPSRGAPVVGSPIGGEPVELEPPPPSRVEALPFDEAHTLLVLSATAGVSRLRPGDVPEPIGGFDVSGDASFFDMLPVAGGTVVLTGFADVRTGVAWFVAAGATQARRLGPADQVSHGFDGRTVWLLVRRGSAGYRYDARQVEPATGRVAQRVSLPRDTDFVAETRDGLVLAPSSVTLGGVWNPRTRTYVRRFAGPVFYGNARYALVDMWRSCRDSCYDVVDVTNGTTRRSGVLRSLPAPPIMSPDGRWLAGFAMESAEAMTLVAQDLTTGRTVTVGSTMSSETGARISWSRDSRVLYFTLRDDATTGQVVAWRAGTPGLGVAAEMPADYVVAE